MPLLNTRTGTAGHNLLDGTTKDFTLYGLDGDDTYLVDSAGDVVVEETTEGNDLVLASITYTLTENVENLTLLGDGNLDGTGNNLGNVITGNDGNNHIDGGIGGDTMAGGLGDDSYIVDNIHDVVIEDADSGIDTVTATATFVLGDNIENLVLTGAYRINGTGNALDNTITGNEGNNLLDGGLGADTLTGGDGDDTYVVDTDADQFSETEYGGYDLVRSAVSWTLAANLEDLALTGSDNIDGTGNELTNSMSGNSGNNYLSGGGGSDILFGGDVSLTDVFGSDPGHDTLAGGADSDQYFVSRSDTVIVEDADGGTADFVYVASNYVLAANIEMGRLVPGSWLLGNDPGNWNLTGNATANILAGNDGDNVLNGAGGADTLYGEKGNDVYYVNSAADVVVESSDALAGGTDKVVSSVDWTLGSYVENLDLNGSGNTSGAGNALNNAIRGNSGNNVLDGAGGNDVLRGGVGDDTLYGGNGDDNYYVDSEADAAIEDRATGTDDGGTDTVFASAHYTLGNFIENLTMIGSGDVQGYGNALDNVMRGNNGNNVLDGLAGADTMSGGLGNDTYFVDNIGDRVQEAADHGTDQIVSSLSLSLLHTNIEKLTLTGSGDLTGTGNGFRNALTGNAGNNALYGLDGNDTLSGDDGNDTLSGGNGNDTIAGDGGDDSMAGGAGDDSYLVDSLGDTISEAADGGTDLVMSLVSWTLDTGQENLTLAGFGSFNGTGNALNNTIVSIFGGSVLDGQDGDDTLLGGFGVDTLTGGSGNDLLIGGDGNDSMAGGGGDDTYYVENAGDTVLETPGHGHDLVNASVTYTLAATLEDLSLSSNGNIDGTGNDQDNVITGGRGNNRLDGGGGNDMLAGGRGNDTYVVDSAGDTVGEGAGQGTDLVLSSVSFSLGSNVEHLTLTGTNAINGIGNGLSNAITGNTANNSLDGGAGDDTLSDGGGTDTLSGGLGSDSYIVTNSSDVVREFADEGYDTVEASVTFTLGDNIEKLVLTGSGNIDGTGNDLGNTLTGNLGDNLLSGGVGRDTLIGFSVAESVDDLLNSGHDTLTGGADNDFYVVVRSDTVIVEATDGGDNDAVWAACSYVLGNNVETAVLYPLSLTDDELPGNWDLTGNASDNVLVGNAGNNALNGMAGSDTLAGGGGDDTYYVDSVDDWAVEEPDAPISSPVEGAGGIDKIISSVSWTLGDALESLALSGHANLTGTGNELDNTLRGNDGDNLLQGLTGNDFLYGGAGNDTLTGGTGDDIYDVDAAGDSLVELSGEGTDSVRASFNFVLGANFENLYLTGTDNLTADGNDVANVLRGNDGSNTLDGHAGADTLVGGLGDDTYYVDDLNDSVKERDDSGLDLVIASTSYTLRSSVENLTLTGTAITGNGNDFGNEIYGNDEANVLNGRGGGDTMDGAGGNDTYYVDNQLDLVTEDSDKGMDTVYSSIIYTLTGNIENLVLTGTGNITAEGNALANILTGNSGDNSLKGNDGNDTLNGGAGNDFLNGGNGDDLMAGGAGDDIYQVGSLGDVVRESAGGGNDTIISTISLTLGKNIECLTLAGGSTVDGIGNALDNVMTSGSANNHMTGGLGADTFVVHSLGGYDTIMDFHASQGDRIELEGDGTSLLISQVGNDAVIDLGDGNSLTILNTLATDAGLLGAITWWQVP